MRYGGVGTEGVITWITGEWKMGAVRGYVYWVLGGLKYVLEVE